MVLQCLLVLLLQGKREINHVLFCCSIAEMLFCTSLMAYVGAGEQPTLTPRKLFLVNTATGSVIQDISLPTSVLAVRLNRERCGWQQAMFPPKHVQRQPTILPCDCQVAERALRTCPVAQEQCTCVL
jgi:hypothetical protein